MKILRFELRAFGPFTKLALDWSKGERGLHVVYGQNEAGKSSALRALRQLLFGIDPKTSDNFLHNHAKLRLGALLRNGEGRELEFVRRKTPVKTPLFDVHDSEKLDADALSPFLGGVDENVFRTMFGLDHDELRRGGSDILQGKGDLGQMLFAAGSGIADLRKVQQKLRDELDELFKPAGTKNTIATTLRELKDKREIIKKSLLPSETFLQKERELNEARALRDKLESEVKEETQKRKRWENIAAAIPFVQTRQNLLNELKQHGDAPILDENFTNRRSEAQTKLAANRSRIERSKKNIAAIDEKLATLEVPTRILEQAVSVEELNQRIGAYQKHAKDYPERDTQRKTVEHAAKEILLSIGQRADLSTAEKLRLRADEPSRIRELSGTYQQLTAKLEKVSEDLSKTEQKLSEAQQEVKDRQPMPDVEGLRHLISSLEKRDLSTRLQSVRNEYRTLTGQADDRLKRLAQWEGALTDLAEAPAPSPETVDRFENEFADAATEKAAVRQRLEEAQSRLAQVEKEKQDLDSQHTIPSPDELDSSRSQRNSLWEELKDDWRQGETYSESRASIFRSSMEHADDIADELRREASRVAEMAQCDSELQRLRDLVEKLTAQQLERDEQYSDVESRWRDVWAEMLDDPLPPREMRAWLQQRTELLNLADRIRDLESLGKELRQEVSEKATELRSALLLAGVDTPDDAALERLLALGGEVVKHWAEEQQARSTVDREVIRLQRELKQHKHSKKELENALEKWRADWVPIMAKLCLEPDASPDAAQQFVDAIHSLFANLREADGYRRRLEGMQRDMDEFREDTHSLAERLLGKVTEEKPDRLAQDLAARLNEAREIQQKVESLVKQREEEETELQSAQSEFDKIKHILVVMCEQAAVTTADELPNAERRAEHRRSLEEQLRELEKNLLPLQGERSLDEYAADVLSHDPIQLESDLQKQQHELEDLNQRLSEEQSRVVELQLRFNDMDGRADAADAENEAQQLTAQLRTDSERFITLSLAAEVLKQGIIRYRDKHHGELLKRASSLFATLTNGSFSKLIADYDEKGEPILMGVRGDGDDKLTVSGMSSGTCDQLYLALRIACLEAYFKNHEPMPLVLDDVLLNFDDVRAGAALDALAELSQKTQVLFFTHHRHLVDLAQSRLDDDVLFVHSLDCRNTRA